MSLLSSGVFSAELSNQPDLSASAHASRTGAARVVMQKLEASCGLAALATLLKFQYGKEVTEELLIENVKALPVDAERLRKGVSLRDISALAAMHGFHTVWKKASMAGLKSITAQAPVIVRYMINNTSPHFAVLEKNGITDDLVYLADPALGSVYIARADFQKKWQLGESPQGYVLLFMPTAEQQKYGANLLDSKLQSKSSYTSIESAQQRNIIFAPKNKWIGSLGIEHSIAAGSGIGHLSPDSAAARQRAVSSSLNLIYGFSDRTSVSFSGTWRKSLERLPDAIYFDDEFNSYSLPGAASKIQSRFSIAVSHRSEQETENLPQVSVQGTLTLPTDNSAYGYQISGMLDKRITSDISLSSHVEHSVSLKNSNENSVKQVGWGYSLGLSVPIIKSMGVYGQLQIQRQFVWLDKLARSLVYQANVNIPIAPGVAVAPYVWMDQKSTYAFGITTSHIF